MALGQVGVYSQDGGQGDFSSPERQLVFMGHAGKNAGKILYIDQSSDLEEVLGTNASKMKTAIRKARLNAGPNWTCIAMPRGAAGEWSVAFTEAMNANLVCEGVVVTDDMTSVAEVVALQTLLTDALNQYSRRLFGMCHTAALDAETQDWATFIASAEALQDGVSADRVMLIPEVFAGWCGSLAGRLCNEAVSIADSPMRVKTGTIVDLAALPKDKNGVAFNMSHAKALNDARMSVPQTYSDYDGIYCSDGMTLAPEASDYQVIENLRVVEAAARRVRVLAIKQIANRELNSTAISIAANETYFMRPLIDMSKSTVFNGVYMPGEVKSPQDGDIQIQWITRTQVKIYMTARPYNSPKSIAAYIGLNLDGEA